MERLLYEYSSSYCGHLIIPFVYKIVDQQIIYSYSLISELSHKGRFHKLENPAQKHSISIQGIVDIAKEHLDNNSDIHSTVDYFKNRYTYRNHLIIILKQANKYYYDHYSPKELNNIAAPKIFNTERECINWIKQGFDRNYSDPTPREN